MSPPRPPRGAHRLPKEERLRTRAEFLRVQQGGRSVRSGPLVLAIQPNDLGRRRVGLTVSRKVGNAVTRNRVKRWLREVWRHHRDALPDSVDVVLIARPSAADAGLDRLREAFLEAAGRVGEAHR